MSILVVCIAALACAAQAATASDSAAASCSTPSDVAAGTNGAVLLQLAGDVGKHPAPKDEEEALPVAALQTRAAANTEKKPKKDGFDFGGPGNSKNNNDNFNFNMNNDNEDKKKSTDKKKEEDKLDFNNNNNDNLNINNNNDNLDIEIEKGKDKGEKKDGKTKPAVDEKGKGNGFNFGNNNDNIGDKIDGTKKAIDNFDFGNGPIKVPDDIKKATAGFKKQVDKTVSQVSTALDDASTHEQAVRKALDELGANSTAAELKTIAEAMQSSLSKAQDKVREAQDQLKQLKSGVETRASAGKSAAGFSSVPGAWLFGWTFLFWMLPLWM